MNRRGIALPAALMALLFSSVTAAMLLSAATLHLQAGARQLATREALEAAAGAVAWHAASWDSALAAGLVPGTVEALTSPAPLARVETRDSLLGLGTGLYLVHSTASARTSGGVTARQVVAQVVVSPSRGGRIVPGGWWQWGR